MSLEPGLYLVGTPIGNLRDITQRAIDTLGEVDLIASEDTRKTGILLKKYNIKKRLISYYDYNKIEKTPLIIKKIKEGERIALVSDAGTPGIQDPGFYLVREAIKENIRVISIPGPIALISALIVSGLPTDRFCFEGFLPRRSGRRKTKMKELIEREDTIIFYEVPHRLIPFLKDLLEIFGDRRVAIARELTKKFEEIRRGKISEILSHYEEKKPRGEFVIVMEGYGNH
jgi:16S rRNA (cytidine1402-2'-O)-methyltransferase